MRRALTCLPLALLFIALVPSKAQKTAAGDAEIVVVVREGAPLDLVCAVRVEQKADWQRDGSSKLPQDLKVEKESDVGAGGLTARLHAKAARPEFAGVYSCARGPQAQRLRVVVEPRAATQAAADPAPTTLAPAPTASKPVILERVPPVEGSPTLPGAEQYYDIPRNMSFKCNIVNPGGEIHAWEKNNTDISKVPELKDRYKLVDNNALLVIQRTSEDDAGNYTCKLGDKQLYWELKARPYTKLPSPDTSVVEGQKLKLVCKVMGKPSVPVEWWYNEDPASYNENTNRGKQLETNDRIKLETSEAGVVNGQLVIEAAEPADAGAYACLPVVEDAARTKYDNAVTVLRVKDMYAALWPFLGICAEVLVLCAIILVYEKRRTKPELDDSDTDNHDQKKS